ncbi:hypothetical protein SCP_0502310 [Sparassis crispa]|uniref:Uncharacterized protein n=1 Tax=Sparassis crispa TaxID=139825 RepID=A0A401GN61_9APHY|nr:hypothetical protein SCP_0502310 [Sparassis crispa]GBE83184.1 hypothetical protein SCP_0502310 [Sparassis crispa]
MLPPFRPGNRELAQLAAPAVIGGLAHVLRILQPLVRYVRLHLTLNVVKRAGAYLEPALHLSPLPDVARQRIKDHTVKAQGGESHPFAG